MQHEGAIADLHGVAGVVSALIADHDIETLSEQIDNLAFALVTPLSTYDDDYFGHCSVDFQLPIADCRLFLWSGLPMQGTKPVNQNKSAIGNRKSAMG